MKNIIGILAIYPIDLIVQYGTPPTSANMFIFTCQFFARQLLFPAPPPRQQLTPPKDCLRFGTMKDNIWPIEKFDCGCAELSHLFEWANHDGGWQYCCHYVLWWSHVQFFLGQLTLQSSIPHPFPKNTTCPSYTSAQVNCPHISVTSPFSIRKEYTLHHDTGALISCHMNGQ